MTTATAERPMAKRNDVVAKIDGIVLADAKVVAACKGMTLAEYLSETLRPIVAAQLQEELEKRTKPRPPRR